MIKSPSEIELFLENDPKLKAIVKYLDAKYDAKFSNLTDELSQLQQEMLLMNAQKGADEFEEKEEEKTMIKIVINNKMKRLQYLEKRSKNNHVVWHVQFSQSQNRPFCKKCLERIYVVYKCEKCDLLLCELCFKEYTEECDESLGIII